MNPELNREYPELGEARLIEEMVKVAVERMRPRQGRIRRGQHAKATGCVRGGLGYLNRTTDPIVRIYADHIEASLNEFNNQLAKGSSEFQMSGRFMGSGYTRVTGTIRPESKNPNFSLTSAIENTEMKAMSKIFQAYGKFDIKRGEFSFFSEIAIRNNRIQGYVKPIFKNMEVADMRTPEDKSLFHKLYAGAVSVMTELMKNRPRQQVATQADISGPLEDPRANIAQTSSLKDPPENEATVSHYASNSKIHLRVDEANFVRMD